MSIKTLLARQPIFDRRLNICAYELLFRSTEFTHGDPPQLVSNGDSATSQVLLNAFTELPLQEVLEGQRAFVNFTRNLLLTPPRLDPKQFVVEVLEDTEFDGAVLHSLRQLKREGFTIALDDFEFQPGLEPVVELADIIKVDVLALPPARLQEQIYQLSRFDCQLLAEKVEDYSMLRHCQEQGFTLYQGFFLCKPELISGTQSSENRQAVLELINKLNAPDTTIEDVVPIISLDPLLSYKLLRIINSPLFGLVSEINSIQHAAAMLGLDRLRSWATLLVLAESGDKPHALTVSALNRARLCQLLCGYMDGNSGLAESGFTTGLFSYIDAFLNVKLEVVLPRLALSTAIKEAILSQQGSLGVTLHTAICCEQARWDDIDWQTLQHYSITPEQLEKAYLDSLFWTRDSLKALS